MCIRDSVLVREKKRQQTAVPETEYELRAHTARAFQQLGILGANAPRGTEGANDDRARVRHQPDGGLHTSSSPAMAATRSLPPPCASCSRRPRTVSYTHLRAHETPEHLVCRLLLEKK